MALYPQERLQMLLASPDTFLAWLLEQEEDALFLCHHSGQDPLSQYLLAFGIRADYNNSSESIVVGNWSMPLPDWVLMYTAKQACWPAFDMTALEAACLVEPDECEYIC